LQSWSASADGVVMFEDEQCQKLFFAAKHNGVPVTLRFYLKNTEHINRYPRTKTDITS